MAMEADGIELGQHVDPVQSAVDAVRQGDIDQAILPGHRNRRLGANLRQRIQPRSLPAAQDHGGDVFHADSPARARPATQQYYLRHSVVDTLGATAGLPSRAELTVGRAKLERVLDFRRAPGRLPAGPTRNNSSENHPNVEEASPSNDRAEAIVRVGQSPRSGPTFCRNAIALVMCNTEDT